jgi:hypothetical protein
MDHDAVMAGLGPAIHVFASLGPQEQDVDARDKRGHDESVCQREKLVPHPQDDFACGLLMRKDVPIRSSTKSISEPAR